jgi:hypothetical protein
MKSTRNSHLGLVLVALAGTVLAASAVEPTQTVLKLNESWVDNSCSVPFYNHIEGTVRLLTLTDKDGNIQRQVNTVSLAFTTTNPYTGIEYPFRRAGSENIYFTPNGDMVYTAHANFDRLIVVGEGALWNNVGYLQIFFPADGSDPIMMFRGNWDTLEDLCAVWEALSF